MKRAAHLLAIALVGCSDPTPTYPDQEAIVAAAEAYKAEAMPRCREKVNPDLRALCVRAVYQTYDRMLRQ